MEASGQARPAEAARAADGAPWRNAVDMFARRVAESAGRTVFRWKEGGTWRTSTWSDWDSASREIAGGLIALGVRPGDRVCLLSNTRPEWMHADVGILMAGAVTVPIYQSNLPDECAYIINDSGATVVIAEDPHQLEKLVAKRGELGKVVKVIYLADQAKLEKPDAKGRIQLSLSDVAGDAGDWVQSLAALRAEGARWLGAHGGELEKRWAEVKAEDVFTIVYTSGTTGPPKGVVLTHRNIVWTVWAVRDVLAFAQDDEQLLFLPLAHIFARILEWATVGKNGRVAFAEGVAQLVANLGEVKPTFLGAVPRVYEKVYAKIQHNRSMAPPTKQRIFDWAFSVGRECSKLEQAGRPVPLSLQLKRRLADRLVFQKIRAVLGGRIRFLISGGAPLAREIAEFFHAAGLLILEGYGLTETTAASFVNRIERYRFGTVGPAIPGLEVKVAPLGEGEESQGNAGDGEILLRGGSILREYWNKPEATREVIDAEGWFHTGDIGHIEDAFLRITDRKKDLIVTAGGKNVAPQNLENALKTTPFVSQVMVHGDKRAYLTALVTLNEESVRAWGEQRGKRFPSMAEAAGDAEVKGLIQKAVDELNATLPSYSTVKKFAILPQDFSQETGELTPTLKVKRKYTTEKFKAIIEGFYPN
jgi:long-chain acyl-CoA synthetase